MCSDLKQSLLQITNDRLAFSETWPFSKKQLPGTLQASWKEDNGLLSKGRESSFRGHVPRNHVWMEGSTHSWGDIVPRLANHDFFVPVRLRVARQEVGGPCPKAVASASRSSRLERIQNADFGPGRDPHGTRQTTGL